MRATRLSVGGPAAPVSRTVCICSMPRRPLQGFMPTMSTSACSVCGLELEKRADLRYYMTTYAMDDLDEVSGALGYDKIISTRDRTVRAPRWLYIRQHGERVRSRPCGAVLRFTQPMLLLRDVTPRARCATFRDCYCRSRTASGFPESRSRLRRTCRSGSRRGAVRVTARIGAPVRRRGDSRARRFAESLRGMIYSRIPCVRHSIAVAQGSGRRLPGFRRLQIGRNTAFETPTCDGSVLRDHVYRSLIDRLDPQQRDAIRLRHVAR